MADKCHLQNIALIHLQNEVYPVKLKFVFHVSLSIFLLIMNVYCNYLLVSFFLFVGSTLTPLTPIPVSEVNKTMLNQAPTIAVLGESNSFSPGK